MIYTIQNKYLKVDINSLGAEVFSIVSKKTNREYLWQGDEKYWASRACNLFPVIGRLFNGEYSLNGKTYPMPPHGLVRKSEFTLNQLGDSACVLSISSSDQTFLKYPFIYEFKIAFALLNNTLVTTYFVTNFSNESMPFCIGGHPGFNIPFNGGNFKDYYIEFRKNKLNLLDVSERCLMNGVKTDFRLDDNKLHLTHELFDKDALIFDNAGSSVEIKQESSADSIKVTFPDFPYLGIWHKPKSDAPYVCIEPWQALPGIDNTLEDLSEKQGYKSIDQGKTYQTAIEIEIIES